MSAIELRSFDGRTWAHHQRALVVAIGPALEGIEPAPIDRLTDTDVRPARPVRPSHSPLMRVNRQLVQRAFFDIVATTYPRASWWTSVDVNGPVFAYDGPDLVAVAMPLLQEEAKS